MLAPCTACAIFQEASARGSSPCAVGTTRALNGRRCRPVDIACSFISLACRGANEVISLLPVLPSPALAARGAPLLAEPEANLPGPATALPTPFSTLSPPCAGDAPADQHVASALSERAPLPLAAAHVPSLVLIATPTPAAAPAPTKLSARRAPPPPPLPSHDSAQPSVPPLVRSASAGSGLLVSPRTGAPSTPASVGVIASASEDAAAGAIAVPSAALPPPTRPPPPPPPSPPRAPPPRVASAPAPLAPVAGTDSSQVRRATTPLPPPTTTPPPVMPTVEPLLAAGAVSGPALGLSAAKMAALPAPPPPPRMPAALAALRVPRGSALHVPPPSLPPPPPPMTLSSAQEVRPAVSTGAVSADAVHQPDAPTTSSTAPERPETPPRAPAPAPGTSSAHTYTSPEEVEAALLAYLSPSTKEVLAALSRPRTARTTSAAATGAAAARPSPLASSSTSGCQSSDGSGKGSDGTTDDAVSDAGSGSNHSGGDNLLTGETRTRLPPPNLHHLSAHNASDALGEAACHPVAIRAPTAASCAIVDAAGSPKAPAAASGPGVQVAPAAFSSPATIIAVASTAGSSASGLPVARASLRSVQAPMQRTTLAAVPPPGSAPAALKDTQLPLMASAANLPPCAVPSPDKEAVSGPRNTVPAPPPARAVPAQSSPPLRQHPQQPSLPPAQTQQQPHSTPPPAAPSIVEILQERIRKRKAELGLLNTTPTLLAAAPAAVAPALASAPAARMQPPPLTAATSRASSSALGAATSASQAQPSPPLPREQAQRQQQPTADGSSPAWSLAPCDTAAVSPASAQAVAPPHASPPQPGRPPPRPSRPAFALPPSPPISCDSLSVAAAVVAGVVAGSPSAMFSQSSVATASAAIGRTAQTQPPPLVLPDGGMRSPHLLSPPHDSPPREDTDLNQDGLQPRRPLPPPPPPPATIAGAVGLLRQQQQCQMGVVSPAGAMTPTGSTTPGAAGGTADESVDLGAPTVVVSLPLAATARPPTTSPPPSSVPITTTAATSSAAGPGVSVDANTAARPAASGDLAVPGPAPAATSASASAAFAAGVSLSPGTSQPPPPQRRSLLRPPQVVVPRAHSANRPTSAGPRRLTGAEASTGSRGLDTSAAGDAAATTCDIGDGGSDTLLLTAHSGPPAWGSLSTGVAGNRRSGSHEGGGLAEGQYGGATSVTGAGRQTAGGIELVRGGNHDAIMAKLEVCPMCASGARAEVICRPSSSSH